MKVKVIKQWGVNILKTSHKDQEIFNHVGKEVIVPDFNSKLQYLIIENPTELEKELFKEWISLLERDGTGERNYIKALDFDMEWLEDEYLAIDVENEDGVKLCYKCFPSDIINGNLVLDVFSKRYID